MYLMNFVKFACNKHLMNKNKTQCLISMSMSSITYTNFATKMTNAYNSYACQTLPRGPAAGASGLQEAAGGGPELQGV